MNPLISILIPAYNAQKTVAETVESALSQTWPYKEVIVVNDGSLDRTADVVKPFASRGVRLISTENRGLSSAMNLALEHCRGDYIQVLDSDDLLVADKIERQVAVLRESDKGLILPSTSWAPFYYRTRGAEFVKNSLCQDLSPAEWLFRKLAQNLHMGNSTWLLSRELAEAAGPWDTRLHYDQDGEYFARVLSLSRGTRFVPGTGAFYRITGSSRVSYIGVSNKKKDALLLSMKLHIEYLQRLEDSKRVRQACLQYLQNWYDSFYPERSDLVGQLQELAATLGGSLEVPRLRWKYAWMKPLFGWNVAKWAQRSIPRAKAACIRQYDKMMYQMETSKQSQVLASTR